eukprot:2710851-Rhodomonas_salina.1
MQRINDVHGTRSDRRVRGSAESSQQPTSQPPPPSANRARTSSSARRIEHGKDGHRLEGRGDNRSHARLDRGLRQPQRAVRAHPLLHALVQELLEPCSPPARQDLVPDLLRRQALVPQKRRKLPPT